jgi:archaellum component FlaC
MSYNQPRTAEDYQMRAEMATAGMRRMEIIEQKLKDMERCAVRLDQVAERLDRIANRLGQVDSELIALKNDFLAVKQHLGLWEKI